MVVDRVNEHFSILDEYERRRIETLFVGFGTRFPGKFENQLKNQLEFTNDLNKIMSSNIPFCMKVFNLYNFAMNKCQLYDCFISTPSANYSYPNTPAIQISKTISF